jgi:hypothetical protein
MKKNNITKKKGALPLIQVLRDLKNYRSWINVIKGERQNLSSKFHKYGISHNYFYVLYLPVTLPSEDTALPDNIKRLRLVETLTPIHQYLDNDLGFADYIIPDFNQFYDDEGNPTLTYGIVYRFAFKKLSLKWVISRGIITILLAWALIKWPIISTLWGWIF